MYGNRLSQEPVYGTRLPSDPVYGTRMPTAEPVYGRVTGIRKVNLELNKAFDFMHFMKCYLYYSNK